MRPAGPEDYYCDVVYTCLVGVCVCLSVCVQRLEEKERQKEEQRRKLEEAKVGGVGG